MEYFQLCSEIAYTVRRVKHKQYETCVRFYFLLIILIQFN